RLPPPPLSLHDALPICTALASINVPAVSLFHTTEVDPVFNPEHIPFRCPDVAATDRKADILAARELTRRLSERRRPGGGRSSRRDRKSTRLNSSHQIIS